MADQASSQFRKEATPIIEEYRAKVRQAFSQVAGRGFMGAPGFLFEAQSFIELEAKQKLSGLNYKILAAQIELELKQSGLAYDLAHRNAVMDWETRKQALFSDWEKELAYMKRDMALEEQDLQALAREVARRGILLEEARSAIALEKEELRKQIEELGGETAEYEVALANARMLTTQKKLETLPYLEQMVALEYKVLEKQEKLVEKNYLLLDRDKDLLEKDYEVLAAEHEVISKIIEIANRAGVLAANNAALAEKDQEVSRLRMDRAAKGIFVAEAKEEVIGKRGKIYPLEKELAISEGALAKDKESLFEYQGQLIAKKESNLSYENDSSVERLKAVGLANDLSKEQQVTISAQEAAILGEKGVLDAQKEVLALDKALIEEEKEVLSSAKELIDKETTLSKKRQTELEPAIASLVEVHERYADEIEIQTAIYSRIADVKGETADLEEQRLERLDLILEKQRELADVTGLLVSGQLALAEHQIRTLLPAIGRLTEAYERLLVEIEKQIDLKLSAVDVRKETALLGIDQVDAEIEVSQANLNTELARRQLAAIRAAREEQQKNIEEALRQLSIDSIREMMDAENISEGIIMQEQATVNAEEQGSRLSLLGQALARALQSHQGLKQQDRATTAYIAGQDALLQRERAAINAAPKITAELEHLLTM